MILCLSAHTDDCELGAGATLYGIKEEKVGYCMTSHSAFHHLLPEMLNAWEVLGIKYLPEWRQDFKHRDFSRQAVLDEFIRLRDTFKPRIVFTHSSFDCHPDHKVVYEESVRAFKHCTILGYDLPWNNVTGSDFRYFNMISASQLGRKLQALDCYESQNGRTYFDPYYQESLCRVNGQQINTLYEERFEIIRWIDRF